MSVNVLYFYFIIFCDDDWGKERLIIISRLIHQVCKYVDIYLLSLSSFYYFYFGGGGGGDRGFTFRDHGDGTGADHDIPSDHGVGPNESWASPSSSPPSF